MLPEPDPQVWRQAPAARRTAARPSRVKDWDASDRARAATALRTAGLRWLDAYNWAVTQGIDGVVKTAMNPLVVFRFLANREQEARRG